LIISVLNDNKIIKYFILVEKQKGFVE